MSNPLHQKLAALIEITINRVLPLDPNHQKKINDLAGQVISISLTDWNMQFFFLPNANQCVVLPDYQGNADVKLSGKGWNFFRMGFVHATTDSSHADLSQIHFEGELATGQKFARLFAELNIDWESELAEIVGDIIAHHAIHFARDAHQWLDEFFSTEPIAFGEYLSKDLGVTPLKKEFDQFCDDLSKLAADSERLDTRFNRLDIPFDTAQDLPSR